MPVAVNWLVAGRIVINRITGILTEDELSSLDEQMNHFLDQSGSVLMHSVWDFSAAQEIPPAWTIKRAVTFPNHERFGWAIFAGVTSPVMKLTLVIAPQLFQVRFRNCGTLEASLEFLQQVDSTLPDLKAIASELI
ncbi:MAG: hypothetical protein H7X77_03970 [Anaerolineae bacterium]|nr:hypothetical protein [Anaerolineae bacterium]